MRFGEFGPEYILSKFHEQEVELIEQETIALCRCDPLATVLVSR